MTTVDEERTLWAWGANNCGQLGCGHNEDLLAPTALKSSAVRSTSGITAHDQTECDSGSNPADVAPSDGVDLGQLAVKQLTGGGAFSVLLTDSGQVLACGKNDRGQLGIESRSSEGQKGDRPCPSPDLLYFSPCSVPGSLRVTRVEAGWDFVLALTDSGTLLSWGSNSFGQLGRLLDPGQKMDPTPQPVNATVSAVCKFVAVAAGLRHALAVSDSGHIYSWGSGRRGQLGVVDPQGKPEASSNVPVRLSMTEDCRPTQVVAGMNFSGVLTEPGNVFVWGCNKFGQCGAPPTSDALFHLPRHLAFPEAQSNHDNGDTDFRIVSLAAGWTHMVCRTARGHLYSLGRADLGQLGRDTDQVPQHKPGRVKCEDKLYAHCCSSEHNLALTEKGKVYSWGWNEHGICGTGDETNVFEPRPISLLMDKTVVSLGCGAGHCFCWTGKQN